MGSFVHFDAIWNWTDVYIWNNNILIHLYNIFFYQMIILLKSGNGQNSLQQQIHFNVKDSLEQTVSL